MDISFKDFIVQIKNSGGSSRYESRVSPAGSTDKSTFHMINNSSASSMVTCFIGHENYLLFLSQLRHNFKFNLGLPVEIVDLKKADIDFVMLSAQTTFLGIKKIYFIFGIDDLDNEKKTALLLFFSHYQGPNQIYFFTTPDFDQLSVNKCIKVTIPKAVNRELFCELVAWYAIDWSARIEQFVTQLFESNCTLSVDMACLLINYMRVIGGNTKDFFNEWLGTIVPSEQSLFILSQHFFKKNKKAFFEQWRNIKDLYEGPFWVSFWSEQLWRAAMFIALNQNQQRAQARVISFRLPFSFTTYDWKNYQAIDLMNAHDFIYSIDYRIKNGGGDYMFDLFYSQFFLNGFASQ